MELAIVIAVVVVALVFDYTNGFHDAANAIATSVSTRALTPRVALAMAAVMNFVGAFLGQEVANTVGSVISPPPGSHGLVDRDGRPARRDQLEPRHLVLRAALVVLPRPDRRPRRRGRGVGYDGGLVDSADKVLIPMIASPLFAFGAGFALMLAIMWGFRRANPHKVGRGFRMAQTVSAAAMALGHGLQDAQKTMGVIFLALLTGGFVSEGDDLPFWVIFVSAAAISLGTYSGGWRIMRTLGRRIIALDPARGFAAESVAAGVLYTTAFVYEAPISTTHTITSAVMGVGATKRFSAVRWGVARSILIAWVLTFPMAGLSAACFYWVLHFLLEVVA